MSALAKMRDVVSSSDLDKMVAWNSAMEIPGTPYRRDCDGRIIAWGEYAQGTTHGWQIDRMPSGGALSDGNVRARHWLAGSFVGGIYYGRFDS
jgi:hypothetical protein